MATSVGETLAPQSSLLRLITVSSLLLPTALAQEGPMKCEFECHNGGYCSHVSDDQGTLIREALAGNLIEKCVCRPGFTGISCENIVEQCADPSGPGEQRTCHNGVPCAPVAGKDGEYTCDCSVAEEASAFAGYMCENPATEYCGDGVISAKSFCTNGGSCWTNLGQGILQQNQGQGADGVSPFIHQGCKCPPEFEGDHCEYLKGTRPEASSPSTQSSEEESSSSRSTGKKAGMGIGIASLLIVALVGVLYVMKRRGQKKEAEPIGVADTLFVEQDLSLEEDDEAQQLDEYSVHSTSAAPDTHCRSSENDARRIV